MSVELIPLGFVKLGASQTMVRPRLDQERVTQAVGINVAHIQLGNQNPGLNPVFNSTGGNGALKPMSRPIPTFRSRNILAAAMLRCRTVSSTSPTSSIEQQLCL
jgi:hypothetical protein